MGIGKALIGAADTDVIPVKKLKSGKIGNIMVTVLLIERPYMGMSKS